MVINERLLVSLWMGPVGSVYTPAVKQSGLPVSMTEWI